MCFSSCTKVCHGTAVLVLLGASLEAARMLASCYIVISSTNYAVGGGVWIEDRTRTAQPLKSTLILAQNALVCLCSVLCSKLVTRRWLRGNFIVWLSRTQRWTDVCGIRACFMFYLKALSPPFNIYPPSLLEAMDWPSYTWLSITCIGFPMKPAQPICP